MVAVPQQTSLPSYNGIIQATEAISVLPADGNAVALKQQEADTASNDTNMESGDANLQSDDASMESEATDVGSEDADEESEDTVQVGDDAAFTEGQSVILEDMATIVMTQQDASESEGAMGSPMNISGQESESPNTITHLMKDNQQLIEKNRKLMEKNRRLEISDAEK
jgi:hypothetical protein